jgi:O-antigen/teichoic acid export membrane protein
MASEALAGWLGFAVTVHYVRALGTTGFGRVEFATVVVGWLLVIVRSGVEQVVQREAARKPRLVAPLTELLFGIKCLGAATGLFLLAIASLALGRSQGVTLILAGLLLVPSAFVLDLGPRAEGALRVVAVSQSLRSVVFAALGFGLVRGPADVGTAAAALAVAELAGGLPCLQWHWVRHGRPRPRWRRRAGLIVLRRGVIASLIRFGRVGLYGADVIVLSLLQTPGWQSYAAARRIVFALVAMGLVVPAAYGPVLGRAWAAGASTARAVLGRAFGLLAAFAVPTTAGLVLAAGPVMSVLFGGSIEGGGDVLALAAARLPFLLAATLVQVALVACRREGVALRVVLAMVGLSCVMLPGLAGMWGVSGVGWGVMGVEAAGAIFGGVALARLGMWVEISRGQVIRRGIGGSRGAVPRLLQEPVSEQEVRYR